MEKNLYEQLGLSDEAVAFGQKLTDVLQRTNNELLMLPRACGPNLNLWKRYISDAYFNRPDYCDKVDSDWRHYKWLNEKSIRKVWEELRAKGVIEKFDESLNFINYFLRSFPEQTRHVITEGSIQRYWLRIGSNRYYDYHDHAEHYNAMYNKRTKGIAKPYIKTAKTLIKTVLKKEQYTVLFNAMDGYVPNIEALNNAKEALRPHVVNIVYILTMGISDNTFTNLRN